ncbi:hypothetical protein [Endozoicomonas atrinae]|uniref:DUF748 domain-containing protein n=1 Tax=Endozoicomonas atrinae TaxID=1333660 RepID=UPI0008263E44|nr:hypothetical protein [Endozoicomonas atrinae]
MPTKRRLLLNPVALVSYLLIGGLFLVGWLWFSQVSDRVLTRLNQQTGQLFIDKEIAFDPWQRTLSVNEVEFQVQGIQLSAERLSFVLNYRHWWGPWLGENIESLSAIELDSANIAIDPDLTVFALPNWFQMLSVNSGSLSLTGIAQPLGFDQLTLTKEDGNRLKIQLDNRDAEHWRFSGSYQVSEGLLSGGLQLVDLSLSTLVKSVPLNAWSGLDNEHLSNDRLSGTMSAALSLSWGKQNGLILKGNAEGQSGQLLLSGKLSGMSAEWQQWQLNNALFVGNDPEQSTAELSVSGLDLRVPEALAAEVLRFPVQLQQILPAFITSLSINDSRLELESGPSPWVFEKLNGSLVAKALSKKGREKDAWKYQANAALANVGNVQLSGQLSGSDNDFTFQLNNARLAGPLKKYSVFAGYTMQGTRFDLSYNSLKHGGQVDISDWKTKKISNDPPLSSIQLLKALITDKSGKAVIPFSIKPGKSDTPLPKRIYLVIGQRFMTIASEPFDYLSQSTGHELKPELHHEAGKATLTELSLTNLEHLKKVLAQRPELNLSVDVNVSESQDGPELSRHELEEALQELYSATSSAEPSDASPIPPKVRATLMEQMYLATRQHQKIPEVGEQSPEQRVQKAEKWLLKNWPKAPDQIEKLQKARFDYLKKEMNRVGIDSGRVELRISGPDQKGGEPDSVLTLR